MIKRIVNHMFHIDENYQLVKTSNNQPVPEDEPLVIIRGRDRLAIPALEHYRELAVADHCNDYMLQRIDTDFDLFRAFKIAHPERMKQPGVTRGK